MNMSFLHNGLIIASTACVLLGCQQDAAIPPTAAINSDSSTSSASSPSGASPVQTAESDEPAVMPRVTGKPVSASKLAIVEKNPEAVAAFENLLRNDLMGEEWERALAKVLELGAKAFPVLQEGLASPNTSTRETAAMILAQMTDFDESIKRALKTALSDESAFVRANAAAALTQIGRAHV